MYYKLENSHELKSGYQMRDETESRVFWFGGEIAFFCTKKDFEDKRERILAHTRHQHTDYKALHRAQIHNMFRNLVGTRIDAHKDSEKDLRKLFLLLAHK